IITAVGSAIGAVFAFILANPIVLLIAGIVALVVIIVKNWDTIKAKTQELWEAVGAIFTQIKDAVMGAVMAFVDFVKLKFDEFKEVLAQLAKFVAGVVKTIASPYVWLY